MGFILQFGDKKNTLVLLVFLMLFFLINSFIKSNKIRFFLSVSSSLFVVAQILSLYFTQSFVGYQFYVHANLRGLTGMHGLFLSQILIATVTFIVMFFFNFYSHYCYSMLTFQFRNIYTTKTVKTIRYICIILLPTIILFHDEFINDTKTLLPLLVRNDTVNFRDILKKENMPDYITPDQIESSPGNNIVIISMESLERAFLDSIYVSLTPNLNQLKNKWSYYDLKQNNGSDWTSGSLYTYLTGFPAFFGVHGNDIFQTAYHSSISGISHVLNNAGYKTVYLNGNADHSGVKEMLKVFDFDKIIDYKNSLKTGYESEYGLRDKDLFSIAKKEIESIKDLNKPFAMFISTTDTHFPNGIYDERMESVISPQKSELEFTVASLDYLIGDFVSFLESNNILENTTIILFPDHLKMGDPSMFEKTGERGLYIITNTNNINMEIKDLYQIDLPKFILSASKVKHNLKFLTDYILGDKDIYIKDNMLNITKINTNGILNSNIKACDYNISDNYAKYKNDTLRFIAHAGGEIDNNKYTNSLEALNLNYDKGFRLFELDIIQTSDGEFVAAHDWEHWAKITNYEGVTPVSRKQFLLNKIYGKYSPLDMDAINNWFKEHDDAILVTDKINDPIIFSNKFIDKNRLMMELFSEKAVDDGLSTGILSAMPSESVVNEITLPDIKKMAQKGVKNIAVSRRFIDKNKLLLQEFKDYNIKPFVYHINFDFGIDEIYVVKYEMDYIYGIYADKWIFE